MYPEKRMRKTCKTLSHNFIPFETQWVTGFKWFWGNIANVSEVSLTEFAWTFSAFPMLIFWFETFDSTTQKIKFSIKNSFSKCD